MPADKTIDTVLMIIAVGLLTLGLGSVMLGWIVRQWDSLMSRRAGLAVDHNGNEDRANRALSLDETNNESGETPQWVAETRAESFTLGETEALARLVVSGKLGLTDAIKIGADAKSGEKYQRRSREIKARAEAMKDKYPQTTPEQKKAREALGLNQH